VTPEALADLFTLAPVGLVVCHGDGRVRQANLAARRLLGPFTGAAPLDHLFVALDAPAPQLAALAAEHPEPRGVVVDALVLHPAGGGHPVRLAMVRTAPDTLTVLVHEADWLVPGREPQQTPPRGGAADDHDWVTGALGRRRFLESATGEVARARRYAQPLTLLLVDPDDFRAIQARAGSSFGSEWLAAIVAACQRESRATDTVGRAGGEAVAMLLPSTDLAGGLVLAERIRERVEGGRLRGEGAPPVDVRTTVSVGVAELSETLPTVDALLASAQVAVERARQAGSNLVVGYDA
jgi:diguanylate cyclase (GGDEF)-like protein